MDDSVPESVWFNFAADDMANDAGIDEFEAWKARMLQDESLRALEKFVAQEMGSGIPTYVDNMCGSYNIVFRFRPETQKEGTRQLALRVPMPGNTVPALMGERTENEVCWMQYFAEHEIVKVPHIYSWSSSTTNDIGHPYILMDFVDGEPAVTCLLRWVRSQDPQDKVRWKTFYDELIAFYLALDSHHFDKIGSITREGNGSWEVTRRPLTHDMHSLLLDAPGTTMDDWPTEPLQSVSAYKDLVTGLHCTQQDMLRSINIPGQMKKDNTNSLYYHLQRGRAIDKQRAMKTARGRILARHSLQDAACLAFLEEEEEDGPESTVKDRRPYRIFNRDLSGRNILVDPDTGKITALIDLEYTNAMPAALAHDPPLCILPFPFEENLKSGKLDVWLKQYQTILNAFLGMLERAEKAQPVPEKEAAIPLSRRMRTSFENMGWLVRFAYSSLTMADIVYWEQRSLFPPVDEELLEPAIREYQAHTKKQIAAFEQEQVASARK